MNSRLLLANARIVNEGLVREGDVLIQGDRIAAIGGKLHADGATVIDLEGRHLLPGVIDDQVHFREPGLTHKASIASESLAAICGGVTSFLDMPNTKPPTTDHERLQEKLAIASATSHANYGFYLGATNTNIEDIRRVGPGSACGIKVFMGASTGNMLVDDERTLEQIFSEARLPVAVHCEDTPMIEAAEKVYRERYGDAVPMAAHPQIRSAEACYRSSSLAVELARRHGTRLHVLHLTTERELELFSAGPIMNKQITVEVCVHHLWFAAPDYEALGTRIKCNPAIKRQEDRDALVAAVQSGVIDVIATDHAPHTLAEKQRPYFDAPAGLPLVQHSLQMLLELHLRGVFSLELIAEKAAHNPARLFGIVDRGFIREGAYADLVAVDLDRPVVIDAAQLRYRCGWSPLEGQRFGASVYLTILNGEPVCREGQLIGRPRGRALQFTAFRG